MNGNDRRELEGCPPSNQLHFGVGVDGNDVIALRRLYARLGTVFTVQVLLDEEVAPLLQVQAAVVAHEAIGVVELVSGLHYGPPAART